MTLMKRVRTWRVRGRVVFRPFPVWGLIPGAHLPIAEVGISAHDVSAGVVVGLSPTNDFGEHYNPPLLSSVG